MDLEQQPEFFGELLALAEALDVELSERRMEIYWRVLSDYDWPVVQSVLGNAMRRKWFKFPQPGELIELIDGNPDDQAEHAWRQAVEATRTIGMYRSVVFEDPATAETIRQVFGGWPEACQMDAEGPMHQAKHKEFLTSYRVIRRTCGRGDGYLTGITESQNRQSYGSWDRGVLPAPRQLGLVPHTGVPTLKDRKPALTDRDYKALLSGEDA